MGAFAAVAGAIVLFAPTAGFMVGSTKVIPADVIKSAASATWSGVKTVGGAIGHAVSGGGSSGGGAAAYGSGGTAPYSGVSGSERASLLSSAPKTPVGGSTQL